MKIRRTTTRRNPSHDVGFSFEALERREMLTIDTVNDIPNITTNAMGPTYTLSLLGRYTDSAVTSVVRLTTNFGNIDIALRNDWAPNTVTNFLQYVNENFYNNTIFHRSQRPSFDANFGLLQGGGFRPPTTDYTSPPGGVNATNQPVIIPSNELHPPVNLEHPTGNFAYTVGLARTQQANSGTSQFYINTTDNSDVFDSTVNPPGYATFGQVLPFTRSTVNAINALTYYNAAFDSQGNPIFNAALSSLPLNLQAPGAGTAASPFVVTPTDYVTISDATELTDLTGVETVGWAATVTNGAAIASVSIVNGNLIITPTSAHNRGTVSVNVHVTSIDGISSIDDTFTFTINNYAPLIGGMQGQSNVAVGQSMLVSAFGVSDPDANTGGGLVGVEYWYDANEDGELGNGDVMVGSDNSAAGGWNARIDTSEMAVGSNRVFARVTDTNGETATTSRVFTLREAVPSSGIDPVETSVPVGQDVNLGFSNELPDISGIRRISLFIDTDNDGQLNPLTDRLIGHATYNTDTASWGYTVNASDLAEGANRVFARVTDNYGNLGGVTSSSITVEV